MVETVKIEGLKELDKKLSKLPVKVAFKALRGAMMKSTTVTFKLAKANALATGIRGRDAGSTAAAMGRWTRKQGPNKTTLFIGPKNRNKKALALYNEFHGTDAKYLKHFHLLEFGSVHGPAQPFLRPAFISTRGQIMSSFRQNLKEMIEKAVA